MVFKKKEKIDKEDNSERIRLGINAVSYVEVSPKVIKGLQGLNSMEIKDELLRGAKLITYEYCISILIGTIRKQSKVHFIKVGESGLKYSIPYIIISLIFG